MKSKLATKTLVAQVALVLLAGCGDAEPTQSSRYVPAGTNGVPSVAALNEAVPLVKVETSGDATVAFVADPNVDHVALARAAFGQGLYADAILHFEAANELGTSSDHDRYLQGLAYWKAQRLAESERTLADAAWAMDDFARAPLNLARVRLELGDIEGARSAIDTARGIEPDLADVQNVLGRVLLAEGDIESAKEAFRRAGEASDAGGWPLNNLGYLHLIEGDAHSAIPALEAALERDATLVTAWHNLALARERTDDLAGAVIAARRAAELAGVGSVAEATLARLVPLAPTESDTAIALSETVPSSPESEATDAASLAARLD